MKKITKILQRKDIEKERVAAYIRVSTDSREQKLSLETQRLHYEKLFQNDPSISFIGIYEDAGISGTGKEKREGLQKLLQDAREGMIDTIYTKSISRFSRNTTECLEMVRELLSIDVAIYFEKENIHTKEMEGEFMLSILASLAESESQSISENNKWSIERRFKKGTYIIADPPFGYRNEDGEMVIVEKEALIVREIFESYLSGLGTYRIARDLNNRGIPTKRNKKWYSTTIADILKNEKYVGDVLFQKTYTDAFFKRHKNRGEKNQYYMQNHHKAIISREIYVSAQEWLEKRAGNKVENSEKGKFLNRYAFSGRLIYGECNNTLKRRIHPIKNGQYVAWTCITHLKKPDECSLKFVRDEDLKFSFLVMLNKLIFAKEILIKPILDTLENKEMNRSLEETLLLEEQMDQCVKKGKKLEKLFHSGILAPAIYTKERSELLAEEERAKTKQKDIELQVMTADFEKRKVKELYEFLKKQKRVEDFDESIFSNIVKEVLIQDRNRFLFRLHCGLSFEEEI